MSDGTKSKGIQLSGVATLGAAFGAVAVGAVAIGALACERSSDKVAAFNTSYEACHNETETNAARKSFAGFNALREQSFSLLD